MRMAMAWGGLLLSGALVGCTPADWGNVAGVVVAEVLTAAVRGGSTALPAPSGTGGTGTGLPSPSAGGTGGGGTGLPLPGLGLPNVTLSGGAGAPNPDLALAQMEQDAFAATNAFRSRLGKPALAWDAQMAAVARAHSADMGKRDYFDHANPEGQSPFDRMRAAGVRFGAAAENIYMTSTQGSAQGAIDAWDKSPGHHRNMAGDYARVGIGISREGGQGTHFTQVFAD